MLAPLPRAPVPCPTPHCLTDLGLVPSCSQPFPDHSSASCSSRPLPPLPTTACQPLWSLPVSVSRELPEEMLLRSSWWPCTQHKPILSPALRSLHELGHLSKGRGLIREAEGGPRMPATKGHQPHPRLPAGAAHIKTPGPIHFQGGGSRDQEGRLGSGTWDIPGQESQGRKLPYKLPKRSSLGIFLGKKEQQMNTPEDVPESTCCVRPSSPCRGRARDPSPGSQPGREAR
ncbi:uncharacterized protein LOC114213266 [Eumetopias jubatus]|uniref:uncharacterized protein LOC114213266 n=1 Tax=Eumetopias jubatus TaxID=34886 RepID=UPI001016FB2E|nr:uncharacterized protein LOC114213266 [Eumetopias jubatus]